MTKESRTTRPVVIRALLCLSVTLAQGYSFGYGNHNALLPMIRYFQGHNLLKNDLILDILPAYTTYFYKAFALVPISLRGVEIVFLFLYLISFYFFYHGMLKFFDLIGDNHIASLLGGMAIAMGVLPLLGLSPWQFKLDHGAPGLAIAAWAIYYYVSGRELLAFSLLGVAFNIHALYSAHLFILFSLHLLLKIKKDTILPIIKLFAAFLFFASPVFIWKLLSLTESDILSTEWLNIIHMRLSSQVFLSDTPPKQIAHFVFFITAILFICKKMFIKNFQRSAYNKTMFLLGGGILLCLVQFLFTDYFPLRLALEGQFWRASQWVAMIGIFLIIHSLLNNVNDHNSWSHNLAFTFVVVLILANTLFSLVVAIAGYLWIEKYKTENTHLFFILFFTLFFTGMIMGEYYPDISPYISAKLRFPFGGLATYMFAITVPVYCLFWGRKWNKFSGISLLLLVLAYSYANNPVYRSINNLSDDPWQEVQSWAKQFTPIDSVFIVPPTNSGFRIISDRGIIGELKDGGMVNNNKKFALEWWRRMELLGVENKCDDSPTHKEYHHCMASRYTDISSEEFVKISRMYNADYVVTLLEHKLLFPVIWENSKYRVFELN